MRDRSIDEFESIFEQASIPVLEIEDITLSRLAVVIAGDALDSSTLDSSALEVAAHLKKRFSCDVTVHWPVSMEKKRAQELAKKYEFAAADNPFHSTAELVGLISIGKSQMAILPVPEKAEDHVDVNALVEGTTPPILLIREPIERPTDIFNNILHSLTGNFMQKQNFAYSFTLVDDRGALRLLHAINENEMHDVRDTLQLSSDITKESGEALIEQLTHHGERYLKAVVAAARKQSFKVNYQLSVGDIVDIVQKELAGGEYGLLVVGSHHEGHSHVTADDYQLMHMVRHIPVLAL